MSVPVLELKAPAQGPSRRRRSRGQSMVLSCLAFFVLALMVTLSFNLSHALRQKMSLQQHSDAMAYSMAVVEARALNYYAVSNRAIAASYVAMTSMHAYLSTASLTREMLKASQYNFYIIAGMEFLECLCWTCIQHCLHGIKAISIASKFSNKANSYANKVKGLESSFNQTVKGLDDIANYVHASQMAMHAKVMQTVQSGSSNGLRDLSDYNAPGVSDLAGAVGGLNANQFNCAVDGMICMGGSNASQTTMAKVMTEVANASRPGWPANRESSGIPSPYYPLHPSFLQEIMSDIPGEGINAPIPFILKGSAQVGKTKSDWDKPGQVGTQGSVIIARDEGGAMFTQWKDGIAPFMPYDAEVWSSSSGGGHSPSEAHSGQHDGFKGISTSSFMSCIGRGNCFMKFRGSPEKSKDYGQPAVYSYVTRSLRAANVTQAPWELNSSATLSFTHGAQGTGTLTLAADEGAGLSKAMVYYHRLGNNGWKEAPTLFNPFWRAKLHPFSAQEAATVLGAAGNTEAAQMAATPELPL